jgi:hypothetical protein
LADGFQGRRTKVGIPTQPATVAGIDVHHDVGEVQLLESIGDTGLVVAGGIGAGGLVGVGDEVRERVGLNDESDGGVRVLLEGGDDGWEGQRKARGGPGEGRGRNWRREDIRSM